MVERNFSEITPEIKKLDKICENNSRIDPKLYSKYKVFRGLRDLEGKGVLTGLTEISEVYAKKEVDGKLIPCHGQLFYRGINIEDLVTGFIKEDRFGFEETAYLLLLGELPNKEQLEEFSEILARSVLTLYSYDENPNDISISNVLRQSLQLISIFPLLSVYGYQAYNHYHNEESLIIHTPNTTLSTAENILYMLRPDSKYSKLEARILDLALVLHAEHGGGNNSSFTTHVVSSSGTDTYSVIAAALGSLKGPKHGGANIKVMQMFKDMKENVHDWEDEEEIAMYLNALLNKEAFDKSGLIYGIGHAIYSVSDPRAKVFKAFVKKLSEEKGLTKEYNLYETVERLAPKVIAKNRKTYKGVSANIDFYSGFVYSMLGLPEELYTPIFAMARIVGWSAHRIEELINADKIIRPAYMNVLERRPYVEIDKRK